MTKEETSELQKLRAEVQRLTLMVPEVQRLTLAVGYLGDRLFAVNPHRAPFELRGPMDHWRAHAAESAPTLGPNEKRFGAGFTTNAGMDAEVARSAQNPTPPAPAPRNADRYRPTFNADVDAQLREVARNGR